MSEKRILKTFLKGGLEETVYHKENENTCVMGDTIMWHIPTWYYTVRTLGQLRCLNCYSSATLLKEKDRAAVSFFTRGSEWSNPDASNVSLPVDPGGPRGPCVPTPGLPFSPFSPGKPKEIVFSYILIKSVSSVYYLTRMIVPYVIFHLKTDGREGRRWKLKIIWFLFHPFRDSLWREMSFLGS